MRKALIFCLISVLTCPLPLGYGRQASENFQSITDFAVPEELGKIDSRFAGLSDQDSRRVLLIQDIHGHLPAQENIAAIIDHLNQLYGIDTFAVEGGWSKTKLPRSNRLKNSRAKQQLAQALLEEEYITGPFYSALFSSKPLKIIGVEDAKLYQENKKAFLSQINLREEAEPKISAEETRLKKLKQETYSPELLSFDAALALFREGRKADSFMPSLVPMAEKSGANFEDLDQVLLFKEILTAEKKLDREKLKNQAQRLVENFGNPRLSFEEILRSGQVSPERLSRYPEILKFQEILALQDALSHHAFFEQIETLISRLKEKRIQNDNERSLDQEAERFSLIKKIVLLKAIPEDIKKASSQKEALRQNAGSAKLLNEFERGISFYQFALKRDAIFFNQITQNPLLSGNIAVVAGGFHTEGLTARLEKKGIPYMIITPSLGENTPEPNEELYIKRMRETLSASEQTLSHLANFPFTKRFDLGFIAGVNELGKTNNRLTAVQTTLTFQELDSGTPGTEKSSALSVSDFMARTDEEQRSVVKEWLKIFEQPSSHRVIIGYKTPVLAKILKTAEGFSFFKNYIAPDRKTVLGELRQEEDEYLSELLGLKQPIRIAWNPEEDPDAAQVLFEKFRRGAEKPLIAFIDSTSTSRDLLVLPEHPASLMMARLLLENRIAGEITEVFLNRISKLITEIFEARGILEKSA